ncbi:unnamed protein product [Timema podura]|uniref:Cytochrome P450 n=1 Tax=Timema podura TaxID=61482 RepID=A0ABN7NQ22_TIMPD|nr:unnamed protein product [Timema podura]
MGNTISVKEISSGYTIDVLASCAFGVNANAINDGNGEFPKILRKIFELKTIALIKQTLVVFLPWLAKFLKLKISENDVDVFVRKTLWDVVGHREKNGIERQDFLLINQKEELDDDDYAAQAHSFLLAGFHTSANTTSFALYELATRPDMQTRLRQEILDVLDKHGGKITHDALMEMTYLDMVISETLRKYPILPFLDRMTLRDYKIPGTNIVLEKGTSVFIPLLGFHNDPKYFPNPKEFNPERFTLENRKSIPNYAYMPFGEGPRKCIGMRFGLITVKTGLVHLLSKFEVRPCQQTLIPLVLDKTATMLTTADTLPLTFSLINS